MATRICKDCSMSSGPPLTQQVELTQCVWCGTWVCRHSYSMIPWPDEARAKPVCERCCDDTA